jgi:uracil-DNA glycosylase
LRDWLKRPDYIFYDKNLTAIVPMEFCYPGKGKFGYLPPQPECTAKWHSLLIKPDPLKIILLVGKYAQYYYLKNKLTLTARLINW